MARLRALKPLTISTSRMLGYKTRMLVAGEEFEDTDLADPRLAHIFVDPRIGSAEYVIEPVVRRRRLPRVIAPPVEPEPPPPEPEPLEEKTVPELRDMAEELIKEETQEGDDQ